MNFRQNGYTIVHFRLEYGIDRYTDGQTNATQSDPDKLLSLWLSQEIN